MASHRTDSTIRALALVVMIGCAGACARPPDSERARTQPPALRDTAETRSHLISESQIAKLREAGLDDPVARIVADLRKHPELIPFPGELGGTMGFYDSTAIHVLNDHWVYASFEDGHVAGRGVFEFAIGDSAKIRWKTVSAYME